MALSILITRPQPAADSFATAVRARLGADVRVIVSPIMRIETLPEALPDLSRAGTLVLTSAHAVAALVSAPGNARPPCYCVGAATAAAVRATGFPAVDGGGTAAALVARLLADRPPGPIHYLRGAQIASDIAQTLSRAGLETVQSVVYRQIPAPPTAEAQALLAGSGPVIVPLFSPRGAALFFAAAPEGAPLYVVAISAGAADRVPAGRAAALITARTPTAAAVLAAIEALASRAMRVESGRRSR